MIDPEAPKTKFAWKKKNKFNAKQTTVGSETFPSKLEADVYAHLKFKESVGLISNLKRQETVLLSEAKIKTRLDFVYSAQDGFLVYGEGKGMETSRWRLIKQLWRKYGPGKLEVYKSNRRGVYLFETVVPDWMRIGKQNENV